MSIENLEPELYGLVPRLDVKPEPIVDASGVNSTTTEDVRSKIKNYIIKISKTFSRYATTIRDRLTRIPYRIRSLPEGVGGQYSPANTTIEISNRVLNGDLEFGYESLGHEMIHAFRDAVVGLGNLLNKYLKRYGPMGYFLFKNVEEGLTTHLYEEVFNKPAKNLYTKLGLNRVMKRVREKLGDNYTLYSDSTKPGEEFLNQTGGFVYLF